jgi:hypothetical protein
VVSRLLKQNGSILVFEIHPIAYLLEEGFNPEKQQLKDVISYFNAGPYNYKDGIDYVGGVQYEAKECFWFMHKMADIINVVLKSGIEVLEFNEYNLEMANGLEAKNYDKFPLSYILTGKKK